MRQTERRDKADQEGDHEAGVEEYLQEYADNGADQNAGQHVIRQRDVHAGLGQPLAQLGGARQQPPREEFEALRRIVVCDAFDIGGGVELACRE